MLSRVLLIIAVQQLYVRFCAQFGYSLSTTGTYHTFGLYNTYYGAVLYVR